MKRQHVILLVLLMAILPALAVSIAFGSISIPVATTFSMLLGNGAGVEETLKVIILQLRLPKAIAAFFVGGGLSLVGVAMQALVRNPLAEPYVLGVSGGASAGASLFYLGLVPTLIATQLDLAFASFLGALLSISMVYLVARSSGSLSVSRLLLAGVAMASFMAAISSFVYFATPDLNRMRSVLFWLMGSFYHITWADLPAAIAVTLAGGGILLGLSRSLDAMLIGEEPAQSLGVPVESVKKILIVLSALVTGTLVSVSGAIGFVGLIIPHSVRSLMGVNHRYVLPGSFLAGGIFLVLADTLARSILPGQQLPVGIVTAIAGVPFFLFLLRRTDYQFK
ncbi:MAG: iron ABC transporter permease [Rhodothermales bacterium]|nr:iron ABC transporter permease [Rhodothermales bacterium]MDG2016294.1 iron ABC transporter permease [Rhodothermales bacterium]